MAREPLTIPEVLKLLAISDRTVRRMLNAGVLKEQGRDPKGRILIDPVSVDQAAIALGRTEVAGAEVKRDLAPTMNNLSEMVMGMHEMILRQNEQMMELARRLGEAQAQARLYPAIAHAAEQRAELLQQELERTRRDLDEARQEVRELRTLFDKPNGNAPSQDSMSSQRDQIRNLLDTD
jgi:hypothetical protein